jgi:hypothetical protein
MVVWTKERAGQSQFCSLYTDSLVLRTPILVTTKNHIRTALFSSEKALMLLYHIMVVTVVNQRYCMCITRCFVPVTCNQPVGIQLLSKLEISMGQEPMNAWWGCFLSKESRNSVKVTCHRLNRPLTAPLLQERLYTSNFMAFASTVCSNFFLWKLTCWEMILWLKIFLSYNSLR